MYSAKGFDDMTASAVSVAFKSSSTANLISSVNLAGLASLGRLMKNSIFCYQTRAAITAAQTSSPAGMARLNAIKKPAKSLAMPAFCRRGGRLMRRDYQKCQGASLPARFRRSSNARFLLLAESV